MSAQPVSGADVPAAEPSGTDTSRSRAWTPEAAMEPVPPLAPPPARPGAGTRVQVADREPRGGGAPRTAVVLAVMAATLALVLAFLLVVVR